MTTGAPLRVLYVEDDRVSAVLMTQLLTNEAAVDLRIAEDGAEALALAAGSWQPQLLILDARLPDTTGHALLARLRALPGLQQVPACMCSADSLPEDRQRAADAGFDGFWAKPVLPTAMPASLRQMLSAWC